MGEEEVVRAKETMMSKAKVMQLTKFITEISGVSGLELSMAQTCEKEPMKSSERFFFEWLVALVVIIGIVLVGFLALRFRFGRMERRVRALEMENQQGNQRFAEFLKENEFAWNMQHDWCQRLERAICRSGGSVETHEVTNDEWRCIGLLNETNKRRILRELSFETSSYNRRYKNRMREMRRGNSPTRSEVAGFTPPSSDGAMDRTGRTIEVTR